MWKKWINIFLAIWLINSVTYLHSSNPFEHVGESHAVNSTADCLQINTWVDCLLQQVIDDGDGPISKAHKIKFQRKYVNSRSLNFSVFLSPAFLELLYPSLKKETSNDVGHYSIGVALLPTYYNFLFRLSPF